MPTVVGTMDELMPAVWRLLWMVLRLSDRLMVTALPFMVTSPESAWLEMPSRASTAVDELEKESLVAPPAT